MCARWKPLLWLTFPRTPGRRRFVFCPTEKYYRMFLRQKESLLIIFECRLHPT
jgi:hypothetical protein